MSLLEEADLVRIRASNSLPLDSVGEFGQFFTPSPICAYMASLFSDLSGDIHLLDPGFGSGSLTASFLHEKSRRKLPGRLDVTGYEIECNLEPFISDTLNYCLKHAIKAGIDFKPSIRFEDFILSGLNELEFPPGQKFTHVIANPPYKKIATSGKHRKALRSHGIESVNLYSAFISLAIQQLKTHGELVAIIPRSFCNGPYYKPFREVIIAECTIVSIHLFDSRADAFSGQSVLQENVIIHLKKHSKQGPIQITTSPKADFHLDEESQTVSATDLTHRIIQLSDIIIKGDSQKFFHIAANPRDQHVFTRMSQLKSGLKSLHIDVSTGPVVDFRLKEYLCDRSGPNTAPLLYPQNCTPVFKWPKALKKPSSIRVTDATSPWLWKNEGYFVLTKRFSSKEEKRRIVATVYDGSISSEYIGFDNKLNVFHRDKLGLDKTLAYGLCAYLNSTMLDKYFRLFSGHTQVNATDIRNLPFPSIHQLTTLGSIIDRNSIALDSVRIDELLNQELFNIYPNSANPMSEQVKIDECLSILKELGLPRAQQNERSALTLLALVSLRPEGSWATSLKAPLIGVTPIMDWCRDAYGKEYAPNTRETFRRQTLHQFIQAGICLYNPDKPDRPVNSPYACYQIAPEVLDLLSTYGSEKWDRTLKAWLNCRMTLVSQYAKAREMKLIPLVLDDGTEIRLSPGEHSQLIHDIIIEFGPRFAPGCEVIYLGDTGAKADYIRERRLTELGISVNEKGKLPDVVLYDNRKKWLYLIESVTSHGPVDGKRYEELSELFDNADAGLIFVTAFPTRQLMAKYLSNISWETEVWTADSPSHLIHFNGDRFMGPR